MDDPANPAKSAYVQLIQLADMSTKARNASISRLDAMKLLTAILGLKTISAESTENTGKIILMRHTYWKAFLNRLRRDHRLIMELVPFLMSRGMELASDNHAQHLKVMDAIDDEAQKADLVVVDPNPPRTKMSSIKAGIITIPYVTPLLLLGSATHVRICQNVKLLCSFLDLKRHDHLKDIQHLEIHDMTISRHQLPDSTLRMISYLSKITFSHVNFLEEPNYIFSAHSPIFTISTLCLRTCIGEASEVLDRIAPRTLILQGHSTVFLQDMSKYSFAPLPGDGKLFIGEDDFWQVQAQHAVIVTRPASLCCADRILRSVETLEMRDCEASVTKLPGEYPLIRSILDDSGPSILPSLKCIEVHSDAARSEEVVDGERELGMLLASKKEIVLRTTYSGRPEVSG